MDYVKNASQAATNVSLQINARVASLGIDYIKINVMPTAPREHIPPLLQKKFVKNATVDV